MAEFDQPSRAAMAFTVCELETVIGTVYCVLDVVGVDPFVV